MITTLDHIAHRFPLVPRPRPACGPVAERIATVRKLAKDAAASDEMDGLIWAAQAQNLAALIASDCGLPDHACALCWRHHDAYRVARPMGAQVAKLSLEPLVNLARLQIRGGDGDAAYALLKSLWHALNTGLPVNIDGHAVSLRGLTATPMDLTEVKAWLWAVLLADGLRALISTGQWQQACDHVERHRGIGRTLIDGRQIAIVVACLTRDSSAALGLLDQTNLAHPWEEAVHACLGVMCHQAASDDTTAASITMQDRYLRLPAEPGTCMFRARLGLTVIDLLGGPQHRNAVPATTHLIREATLAGDGYMAREVLTHLGGKGILPAASEETIVRTVQSSGLHGAGLPTELEAELLDAASTAHKAIRRILRTEN